MKSVHPVAGYLVGKFLSQHIFLAFQLAHPFFTGGDDRCVTRIDDAIVELLNLLINRFNFIASLLFAKVNR